MDTKELKKITEQFSVEQLEACIQQQLAKGENACNVIDSTNNVIEALSKAGVIREIMNQGLTFSEALRELGRRIRAVYGQDTEDQKNGSP